MCMPMTHKSRVPAALTLSINFSWMCRLVSLVCRTGCVLTGCNSTRRKLRSCGVQHLVSSIGCLRPPSRSAPTMFTRRCAFVAWVYTLTVTSPCVPRWRRWWLAVSVCYAGFILSVAQYQILSSSLWLCRWYLTDWISATRRSPAYQLISIAGCTQSVFNAAARLIYRRRRFDHVTPLLRDLHWLKVPISWPWLSIGAYMAWHRRICATTCSVSQKWIKIGAGCVLRRCRFSNQTRYSLPTDVTPARTLPVFCSRLKSYLFSVSFPAWPVFV